MDACYIADPSDSSLATKLVDLNSVTGTSGSGFQLLGNPDFGAVDTQATWLTQAPYPGAIQATRQMPPVTMTLPVRVVGTSYDDVVANLEALAQALDAGGTLVWQADGSSNPRYIQFFPSPIASLLRGQDLGLYKVVKLFQDPDGFPIEIWRQPYMLGPQLLAATNVLANGTLLEDHANAGTPDSWAWDATGGISNQAIDLAGGGFTFQAGTTATRNLQQTYTGGTTGDVWTASYYAKTDTAGAALANAVAYAEIDFLTAGGSVISSGGTSTGGTLTSAYQRVTVTSSAAPASTGEVRMSMRMADTSGSAVNVWFARAQLEKASAATDFVAGSEVVSNDITTQNGKHAWLYNPGNAPALAKVTVAGESGSSLIGFQVARRSAWNTSGADLDEYVNHGRFAFRAASATMGSATTATADSQATGGTAAVTDFSATSAMQKRWRYVISPTDTTTLAGSYHVVGITKAAHNDGPYTAQVRWATYDDSNTTTNILPTVTLNTTGGTADMYCPVDYGVIRLASPSKLALEMWAYNQGSATSGALSWDQVVLVPATEQYASYYAPQSSSTTSSGDLWLGSQLSGGATSGFDPTSQTNGAVSGTDYVLTANLQACGTPPVTGKVLPAGLYTVTFSTTITPKADATNRPVATVAVREYGSPGSDVSWATLYTSANASTAPAVVTLSFTADGTSDYLFEVRYASASNNAKAINVHSITSSFTPTGETTFVVDANSRQAVQQYTSTEPYQNLVVAGPFIELAPGFNLLLFDFGDVPTANAAQPLSDLNLPLHVYNRAPTVTVDVTPRYLGL